MALYEHVFLARQDLSQAQVDALAATATEIVEAGQGKVTKTETWGLKNLAYKIKRNRKAHFVMLNIEAPAGVVAELERQLAEVDARLAEPKTYADADLAARLGREREDLQQQLAKAEEAWSALYDEA